MNVNVEMRVKLRQLSPAGIIVSETPWQKNLVMDNGLNALARSANATSPAVMFSACRVGSGSTSDKISSGAVTFTQSGNTLTASAPFFTLQMVGQLFKWGTGSGGVETYITAFTDSQNVTVADSATVAVPEVGTVWNVARTTLENLLYSSASYETTPGSCFTSFTGNQVTHQRTFNFAQQVAPYNVNEVGYFNSTTGTTVFGRLVLSSTEVVNPTNFLQVVLQLVVTYSPGATTAVPDVGTNIDTSGTAVVEYFSLVSGAIPVGNVNSNGSPNSATSGMAIDASASCGILGITSNYTQNANTGINPPSVTTITFSSSLLWQYSGVRGRMTLSSGTTISTSGQTLYGIALGNPGNSLICFDVKFNTPYVMPTGSFLPQVQFAVTYGRTLTN